MALLAACGGSGSSSSEGSARIRLLDASAAYAAMDFYVDDALKNSTLAYGRVGDYTSVATGSSLATKVTSSGSSSALASTSLSLAANVSYTMVAYGWQGAIKTALLQEDVSAAASGKSKLMVLNAAPDAGSLDVYLTGTEESLDNASPVAAGVAGGSSMSHSSVSAGSYRLRITAAGDKTDLRLDLPGLTLDSTQVAALVVTPGSSGVLVHALLLTQQAGVQAFNNTQARARVLASVSGNGRVTASVGGNTLMAGGLSPTIGGWGSYLASNSAVQVSVNGMPVAVPALGRDAGSDTTLLVWGEATAPQVSVIAEDLRLPGSATAAKLRLVHGVSGLADALTLTADFSLVAADVAPGAASAFGSLTASTGLRLDVSSPLVSSPLYTLTEGTLAARGLYTLFMLGDAAHPSAVLRRER